MSDHIDTYALANGHPPSAASRVLVDFDKTIRPWGELNYMGDPLPGAADALRRLDSLGYDIVILTSRMSPTWWRAEAERRDVSVDEFAQEQGSYVAEYLAAWGIPFSTVTCEKMPGLAFFDDTAVRVGPEYTLADAVGDFLKERGHD